VSDRYERDAAQAAINTLQRALVRVVKQRDILMTAMEEISGGAHGWKTCVDQIAPRAIADATGQTYDEVIKKLTGLEGGAQ